MMAPQSARVNGTVFGRTVRMKAKRRLEAFFDARYAAQRGMAENAWSASFDASKENTGRVGRVRV